jgi:hypothetical protein
VITASYRADSSGLAAFCHGIEEEVGNLDHRGIFGLASWVCEDDQAEVFGRQGTVGCIVVGVERHTLFSKARPLAMISRSWAFPARSLKTRRLRSRDLAILHIS